MTPCASTVEVKASAASLLNKWMALFGRSAGELALHTRCAVLSHSARAGPAVLCGPCRQS